jgi:multidrug efflux pump subunit AcrA (membrane-fusion protein)
MLEEAIAAREYVSLRAPFDGTVSARFADPGDLAVPGRPVLVITGSKGVKVEADLPAAMADAVSEGDRVTVVVPENRGRWPATVRRVVPVIDLASHRFRVEATFDSSVDVPLAGSFVRLEIAGRGERSVWIPLDALVRRGQLTGVLRLRWIRTGRRTAAAVEVLAGLAEGTLVVRKPDPGFMDGAAVAGTDSVAWVLTLEGHR